MPGPVFILHSMRGESRITSLSFKGKWKWQRVSMWGRHTRFFLKEINPTGCLSQGRVCKGWSLAVMSNIWEKEGEDKSSSKESIFTSKNPESGGNEYN